MLTTAPPSQPKVVVLIQNTTQRSFDNLSFYQFNIAEIFLREKRQEKEEERVASLPALSNDYTSTFMSQHELLVRLSQYS